MSEIKIKNFGPIKAGYQDNDGWMDIEKVTVFIGNQGSGKSSVAKLISTMTWLEKALYQGKIREKEAISYNRFVNTYCAYHNLKSYFDKNGKTEIEYSGSAYNIKFSEGKLTVEALNTEGYRVPKIMYVPAERNFLSAVKFRNLEKLKELPLSLFTFLEELERSQNDLSDKIKLPIGNVEFEFDKLNETANIVGDGYKLKLLEASSGFQSFVPLFLVSQNLSESINKEQDLTKSNLSSEEQKRIDLEAAKIVSDVSLSYEVKVAALRLLSSKFKNECFINIVEEIEQNLYPTSQKEMLFNLLKYVNENTDNQLILTTHSPYIINYLSIAIQGYHLMSKIVPIETSNDFLERLEKVVPLKSLIYHPFVVVYQLDNSGNITKLPDYKGIPSDENFLNKSLAEGNELFDNLLEIEEDL
jgi:predicted ATPase